MTLDEANQLLKQTFGLVEGEAAYRFAFAPSARSHSGAHLYVNPNEDKVFKCYILERRQPPAFFGSRTDWNLNRYFYDDIHQKRVDLKGNYPPNDGYVMICPVSNEGEFLPLTEAVFQSVLKKIKADLAFDELNAVKRSELVREKDSAEEIYRSYQADKKQESIDEYYLKNFDRLNRQAATAYSFTPR